MKTRQSHRFIGFWNVLLLAASACAATPTSQRGSSPPSSQPRSVPQTSSTSPSLVKPSAQEDRAAIEAQSRRFSQAYVEGDHETLVSIYTEDATLGPAGLDFVVGRDQVRAFWKPQPGKVHRHAMVPEALVIDGDHAYDRGRYSGSASGPNAKVPKEFGGNYLVVWRRDTDGVWRMEVDVWYGLDKNRNK